eukprot:IDg3615t1
MVFFVTAESNYEYHHFTIDSKETSATGFNQIREGWRLSDNNRKYNYKKRDADDGKLFRAPKENAALRRIFTERPPRNTETLLKLQKYFRNIDNKLRKKRATDRKNKQCDER